MLLYCPDPTKNHRKPGIFKALPKQVLRPHYKDKDEFFYIFSYSATKKLVPCVYTYIKPLVNKENHTSV